MIELENELRSRIDGLKRKIVRKAVATCERRIERELPEKIGKELSELHAEKGFIRMRVERSSILKLCRLLRDSHKFNHLSLITTVDWDDRFELVYHLFSYPYNCAAEIKVDIPRDDPKVDSVTPLWGGANWHEREAYDMMGIVFLNHPDLRRILLPQEYEYFPLRKDFKMELE